MIKHVRLSVLALAALAALPGLSLLDRPIQAQPAGSLVAQQQGLALSLKDSYAAGEAITVEFAGLPGNPQDWITVVEANAPDDTYGDWFYTEGQRQGSYTFDGLTPGTYEVRVYFNWPDGGYTVQDRYRFTVGSAGSTSLQGYAQPQRSRFAPGEPITVHFANLPGNPQDWITVVEANAPDDTYGAWFYTEGQRQGSYTFEGLAPGTYEVRVYFNWPDGGYVVQERDRFIVE